MARGRPKIYIDKNQFENLCRLQCTLAEIASWFRCSEDTVERWCKRELGEGFAASYEKYAAAGKISLRRSQFKLAEKNAAMAIFLGKQYLGQTDDPRRYTREETTEDKLDRLLDTVNSVLDGDDDGD